MRPLDPAIKTVWTIKLALAAGFVTLASFLYEFFKLLGEASRVLPFGVLTALVLVGGVALCATVPRLRYRYWRYELLPEELYLERGILNRVKTVVPLRRIQHLDVSQDILEREYGLGKLIVHTAGVRSSDVVLPGLRMEDAERLRMEVKQFILEDAV
jgi:membrane protein YdbS with pleckstrin-like domain